MSACFPERDPQTIKEYFSHIMFRDVAQVMQVVPLYYNPGEVVALTPCRPEDDSTRDIIYTAAAALNFVVNVDYPVGTPAVILSVTKENPHVPQ